MLQRVLVDTDILIDVGREEKQSKTYLRRLEEENKVLISIITQMEMLVGCRNKTELRKLERFLRRFEVIHLSQRISEKAVDLLRQYRLSHGLLLADSLIAATALLEQVRFVTKNQRDYRFIEALQLIAYPVDR